MEWLVVVSKEFPGVTWTDVWDYPYWLWCQYVDAVKQIIKARKEASSV